MTKMTKPCTLGWISHPVETFESSMTLHPMSINSMKHDYIWVTPNRTKHLLTQHGLVAGWAMVHATTYNTRSCAMHHSWHGCRGSSYTWISSRKNRWNSWYVSTFNPAFSAGVDGSSHNTLLCIMHVGLHALMGPLKTARQNVQHSTTPLEKLGWDWVRKSKNHYSKRSVVVLLSNIYECYVWYCIACCVCDGSQRTPVITVFCTAYNLTAILS